MPDPTPEHVAAVARLICGDPIPAWPWCLHEVRWGGEACSMGIDGGASILTSTDPVVLDAMLAALVRAGRLTEERRSGYRSRRCDRGLGCAVVSGQATVGTNPSSGAGGVHFHVDVPDVRTRLVTEWREVAE